MIPVLFHLGPLTVYSFGLMMALGFLAADYVIRLECVRRGYDPEYSSSVVIAAAVMGLLGSRIYAILDDLPTYLADPKLMVFSGSGFVFYGGMIGGILGAYLVSRWYRIGFASTMDMCAPALAIGQAIGRIGCQLAGDGDWGLPSNLPWAMAYPRAIVGWNSETVLKLDEHYRLVSGYFPGVRVHPAPVYETILYLGVFTILWSMRKTSHPAGRLIYWYLVLAGGARFLVEFVRINPRVFYGLSEAQLIAFAMVVLGGVALILTNGKHPAERDQQSGEREKIGVRCARRGPDDDGDQGQNTVPGRRRRRGHWPGDSRAERAPRDASGSERAVNQFELRGTGGGWQSGGGFQARDARWDHGFARFVARQGCISQRLGDLVRAVPRGNALDADVVRRLQGQQGFRDACRQPGHRKGARRLRLTSRRTATTSRFCSTPKTS